MKNKEKIIMTIILIILLIAIITISILKEKKGDLKIYFFNAGKADSVLISKNNKYIMIDTGEESLSNEILGYFKKNNITKLDYLIITHFDKDHVGSASVIIDNIEIGEVLQSNVPKESVYYTNYINSLNNKNITPKTVEGNYEIKLDNLKITVNGPESIYDKNKSNNSSLIVSIINGNNSFLFMGDSENKRIKDFLSINQNTYDFIKIPYHGNYLKRLDSLIKEITPKYGVLTCSEKEGCEEETLKILDNNNVKYYLTKNGSITIYSDGKNITVKQ